MRVPQLATHYMIDDKEHLAVGKSIKSPYRHYNCYCWAATHDFAHSERSAWIRLCSWNGESNEDKKRQIESQLKPWHNRGNFHRLHQQRSIHLIKPMIRVTCQANMCMHLQNRAATWKCSWTRLICKNVWQDILRQNWKCTCAWTVPWQMQKQTCQVHDYSVPLLSKNTTPEP